MGCSRYLRMVPAHLYIDGDLTAHLWVCQACGRAQAPIQLGQGLPFFPRATAGVATRPLMAGRSSHLSWMDLAPHRESPGLPRPHALRAELTPVPDEDDAQDL